MIRAIKVEKCLQCLYCREFDDGDYCVEKTWKKYRYQRRSVDADTVPESCPLPPWPSVTKKSIGYWRELIKQFEADGLDSIDVFEDMFKSIGVEIVEEKDDYSMSKM